MSLELWAVIIPAVGACVISIINFIKSLVVGRKTKKIDEAVNNKENYPCVKNGKKNPSLYELALYTNIECSKNSQDIEKIFKELGLIKTFLTEIKEGSVKSKDD